MSISEIISELPRLSELERRAVWQKLVEIASEDPDVASCNPAALEGAMLLDRMEAVDARRTLECGDLSPLLRGDLSPSPTRDATSPGRLPKARQRRVLPATTRASDHDGDQSPAAKRGQVPALRSAVPARRIPHEPR